MDSSNPAVTDILKNQTDGYYIDSFLNFSNRSRFKILLDKYVTLVDNTESRLHNFQWNCKLRGVASFLSGTSVPNKNGLYMLLVSDSYAISHPNCDLFTRVSFVP